MLIDWAIWRNNEPLIRRRPTDYKHLINYLIKTHTAEREWHNVFDPKYTGWLKPAGQWSQSDPQHYCQIDSMAFLTMQVWIGFIWKQHPLHYRKKQLLMSNCVSQSSMGDSIEIFGLRVCHRRDVDGAYSLFFTKFTFYIPRFIPIIHLGKYP